MNIETDIILQPVAPDLQFPCKQAGYYFNHAAISPWPAATAAAVAKFAAENARQGPAAYSEWLKRERRLRKQLATLVGAASDQDIALVKNTTEAISVVAWGLDWRAGDNLVLPEGEFPSNRLPWLAQRERGVEIREVDIRGAENAEQALISAMDRNTRLLAVSSVQWRDGFRLDLEQLGAACKARGALFFVDAIQQLGALQIDVSACHINFLAADAHKWLLGPEGIAIFYSDAESRPLVRLRQLGWHMFENPWSFDPGEETPTASARRFEAGSPNTLGQVALSASLDVLFETGLEKVEQQVLDNTSHLLKHLSS
ncbi:MAG: aminotransferase class V-fold PLP-dependent enzyme, partial [Lysobacterales bacterium]